MKSKDIPHSLRQNFQGQLISGIPRLGCVTFDHTMTTPPPAATTPATDHYPCQPCHPHRHPYPSTIHHPLPSTAQDAAHYSLHPSRCHPQQPTTHIPSAIYSLASSAKFLYPQLCFITIYLHPPKPLSIQHLSSWSPSNPPLLTLTSGTTLAGCLAGGLEDWRANTLSHLPTYMTESIPVRVINLMHFLDTRCSIV